MCYVMRLGEPGLGCSPFTSKMPTKQNTETENTKESNGIPRTSLASAVADKLRAMIIHGDVQEGEQLRQDEIASWFQVSRIPVREALRQLEAEGLVTIVPHHGAVVSALSPEEIRQLFELRSVLEVAMLRWAVPCLTDSDLDLTQQICLDF